jgi:hypothetical protein
MDGSNLGTVDEEPFVLPPLVGDVFPEDTASPAAPAAMDRLTAIERGLVPPPVTQAPAGGRLAGPNTGLDPSIDQVMRDTVIVDPADQDFVATGDQMVPVPKGDTVIVDPADTAPLGVSEGTIQGVGGQPPYQIGGGLGYVPSPYPIAADGSNVVDFSPYTGDEFVRIGDQMVSRADLQRRGSDYYTRPIQESPMRRQQSPMYGGKGGYYR